MLQTVRCWQKLADYKTFTYFSEAQLNLNYSTNHKYEYIKSTTVYVPSAELGLSQPLSRQRVCPSPQNREGGGGTLTCGWGVGGVPIPTTGEKA